jgi:ribose transport system ATP-binding protein
MPGANDAPVLSIRGLRCSFGQTRALRGVDLDVHAGEVVALLGKNGSGKSTLIKILAGVYKPDAGTVEVGGHQFTHGLSSTHAAATGLAFVHQDLGLILEFSVAENIAQVAGFRTRRGLISWADQRAAAAEALDRWGFDIDPAVPVGSLDPPHRALVAITRALAAHARVIVLDEPTASLPGYDVEILFSAIRRLRSEGVAVLYVTHRMGEVPQVADRVVVLRDGLAVADEPVRAVSDEEIAKHIVGDVVTTVHRRAHSRSDEPVLELRGVSGGGARDVSLTLQRGEILALVGVVGAGQRTIGRMVAGAERHSLGAMRLQGKPYRPKSPRDAIARGVSYLPADRLREGGFLVFDTACNFWLRRRADTRWIRLGSERRRAGGVLREWDVTPSAPTAPFAALSGGNQQRVLLAKWIGTDPSVLVVEEPGAGVDIHARQALYARLGDISDGGIPVLLVSSDSEEVAELADRAVVFEEGRVSGMLEGDELTPERVTLECSQAVAAGMGG